MARLARAMRPCFDHAALLARIASAPALSASPQPCEAAEVDTPSTPEAAGAGPSPEPAARGDSPHPSDGCPPLEAAVCRQPQLRQLRAAALPVAQPPRREWGPYPFPLAALASRAGTPRRPRNGAQPRRVGGLDSPSHAHRCASLASLALHSGGRSLCSAYTQQSLCNSTRNACAAVSVLQSTSRTGRCVRPGSLPSQSPCPSRMPELQPWEHARIGTDTELSEVESATF